MKQCFRQKRVLWLFLILGFLWTFFTLKWKIYCLPGTGRDVVKTLVIPGLYIGSYRDSKDVIQLQEHGITHIVAVHDTARKLFEDRQYLCILAADTPSQNLTRYFSTCNDFIHEARLQGGSVLIHCLAGMSRSVTVAVAYLMSITSLEYKEALHAVRGARAVANPNAGFQRQLQDFNGDKAAEERRRLHDKFGSIYSHKLETDEASLKKMVLLYQGLIRVGAMCDGVCTSLARCPTGICRARLSRNKSTKPGYSRVSPPQQFMRERYFLEFSKRRPMSGAKSGDRRDSVVTLAGSRPGHPTLLELKKSYSQPVSPVQTPQTPPNDPQTPPPQSDAEPQYGSSMQDVLVGVFVKPSNGWSVSKLTRKLSKLFTGHDPLFSSLPDIADSSSSPVRLNRLGRTPSSDDLNTIPDVIVCPSARPEVTHAYESDDGQDPLD